MRGYQPSLRSWSWTWEPCKYWSWSWTWSHANTGAVPGSHASTEAVPGSHASTGAVPGSQVSSAAVHRSHASTQTWESCKDSSCTWKPCKHWSWTQERDTRSIEPSHISTAPHHDLPDHWPRVHVTNQTTSSSVAEFHVAKQRGAGAGRRRPGHVLVPGRRNRGGLPHFF